MDAALEIEAHSNDQGEKCTKKTSFHDFKQLNFKWILLTGFQRLPRGASPMTVHSYKDYFKSDTKSQLNAIVIIDVT